MYSDPIHTSVVLIAMVGKELKQHKTERLRFLVGEQVDMHIY